MLIEPVVAYDLTELLGQKVCLGIRPVLSLQICQALSPEMQCDLDLIFSDLQRRGLMLRLGQAHGLDSALDSDVPPWEIALRPF